jgi:hypothetical protein
MSYTSPFPWSESFINLNHNFLTFAFVEVELKYKFIKLHCISCNEFLVDIRLPQ